MENSISKKEKADLLKRAKELLETSSNDADREQAFAYIEATLAGAENEEYGDWVWEQFKECEKQLLELVVKKADENNPLAIYLLVHAWNFVDDPRANDINRNDAYEKAAELGNSDLKFVIAKEYLDCLSYGEQIEEYTGCSEEEMIEKAKMLLEEAAEQGHKNAQFNYGMLYVNGFLDDEDETIGYEHCKAAAEGGVVEAQLNYGLICLYKLGQFEEGKQWLIQAATAENADAMYYLADLYDKQIKENNESDPAYKEALKWFRKAAKKESACAKWMLAVKYDDDSVVKFRDDPMVMRNIINDLYFDCNNPVAGEMIQIMVDNPSLSKRFGLSITRDPIRNKLRISRLSENDDDYSDMRDESRSMQAQMENDGAAFMNYSDEASSDFGNIMLATIYGHPVLYIETAISLSKLPKEYYCYALAYCGDLLPVERYDPMICSGVIISNIELEADGVHSRNIDRDEDANWHVLEDCVSIKNYQEKYPVAKKLIN